MTTLDLPEDVSAGSGPVADAVEEVVDTLPVEDSQVEDDIERELSEPIDAEEMARKESAARATAESQFRESVKEAEEDLVEANLREKELAGELKAAKSHRTDCIERLQRLKVRGPQAFYVQPQQKKTPDSQEGEQVESTDWRSVRTEDLLQDIEGMGKKKLESITELFPTLGDLEDARGEASKDHQPFSKVLPKGIGQQLADQIENAMIEAIK